MTTRSPMRLGLFVAAGLLVAAALAFFVSPQASTKPDGLEKVAADQGFDDTATAHAIEDSPTADYAVAGIDNEALATGLAGLIGVGITFALGFGLTRLVRGRSPDDSDDADRAVGSDRAHGQAAPRST